MKPLRVVLTCISVLIVLAAFIRQDNPVDVLSKKLWTYRMEHPAPLLHLHLDKNVYTTNEDIWFKAYILNHEDDSSTVLYVRLTDLKKRIILTDQFPIKDIRANGDLLIPDTLKDGNYYLYAYTNRMINYNPDNVFVQRITVTHNSSKRLYAEAAVLDTTQLKRGHKVQIQVRVKDGDDLLKNIKGEYRLITGDGPDKMGKISTNHFGEANFSFTYPNLTDDKTLNVNISFKNDVGFADLTLNLKHEGNPIKLNLYPEGGHFIAGIATKVALQATDIRLNPIIATITLKNKGQAVARAQLDKNGRGVFRFTPDANAAYTIDAESNGIKTNLPFTNKIEPKGYTLSVSKQKDGFKLLVKNNGTDDKALLVLRSFDEILWSQPVTVASGDSTLITIPAVNLPKEVLNIAAFDAAGNLLSERLFLNRMDNAYRVSMKTDQQIYGARKKVTVTLNVTDAEGKPVIANLSVSAAEKERTNPVDERDILDTWYLRSLDNDGHLNLLSGATEAGIDNIMIAKNWWHYQWADMVNYKPKGKITRIRNTDGVVGYLTPLVKKPKHLTELVVMGKRGLFTTPLNDAKGFSIAYTDLVRQRGEKEYLIMNADLVDDYKINVLDYPGVFDGSVALGNSLFIPQAFNTLAKYEEVKQAFAKGVIQLKEVQIKSGGGTSDVIKVYTSTNCNDMVCMYNILNCVNHPGCCTLPVDGGIYKLGRTTVIYRGCGSVDYKTHIPLKCISIPKNFYLPNYDKETSYEPELHSTIYWNPNLNTDKNGNATFSFYTSDIAGDFLMNAQGVDAYTLKPLSGKAIFKVR